MIASGACCSLICVKSEATSLPQSVEMATGKQETRDVSVPPIGLRGTLDVPRNAHAFVVFAHGSGSSRLSPGNRAVADALNSRGIATLLFDLLTPAEEADRRNVFNIPLLADLADAVNWLGKEPYLARLPLGLFGASTGAAATHCSSTSNRASASGAGTTSRPLASRSRTRSASGCAASSARATSGSRNSSSRMTAGRPIR